MPEKTNVDHARRRLSVLRGTRDANIQERDLDGSGKASQADRRNSVCSETKQQVFSRYAVLSKVGFVPFNPDKVNQDRACKVLNFGGDESKVLFGCFDGHGTQGHEVSTYVSQSLPGFLVKQQNYTQNPTAALIQGFVECNAALAHSNIDCSFSGSTAIVVFLWGHKLYSCNAGDSRAVLAREIQGSSRLRAIALSDDQKPDRPDEKKRIIDCKGRVEACKGARGEDVGPQRVWLQHQDVPGLAMARSFGDLIAASVGVIARPEVWYRDIDDSDRFMILASDGVWEFISNQEAVDLIANCDGPQTACRTLVDESTRRWQQEEEVIDDITCMVVYF